MTIIEPLFLYRARVERWVDGDTIDLTVDLGFYASVRVRCRLYGINTPERGEPYWAAATALASSLAPVGSTVVIYSKLPADKYGRFLVLVYPEGTISTVNQALLDAGFATPYSYRES